MELDKDQHMGRMPWGDRQKWEWCFCKTKNARTPETTSSCKSPGWILQREHGLAYTLTLEVQLSELWKHRVFYFKASSCAKMLSSHRNSASSCVSMSLYNSLRGKNIKWKQTEIGQWSQEDYGDVTEECKWRYLIPGCFQVLNLSRVSWIMWNSWAPSDVRQENMGGRGCLQETVLEQIEKSGKWS